METNSFVKKYPVAVFFILVFLITWGGIALIASLLGGDSGVDATTRVAIVSLPMLVTPAACAVLLTALLEGRAGLAGLWRRMTLWRVEGRWYLFSLLVMPLLVLIILVGLSYFVSPDYAPILSLLGLAGIAAGYLEEFGWTGFAIPRLLVRWRPLVTGLVVGVLWATWHGLADYVIRGSDLGGFWPLTFGLFMLPLIAWRVLMAWVYAQTRSGLLAQIMHFSYTGSLALFIPVAAITPAQDALVYSLLSLVLWFGVLFLAVYQQRTRAKRAPAGVIT